MSVNPKYYETKGVNANKPLKGIDYTKLVEPAYQSWGRGHYGQPSHGAHWRMYLLEDGHYVVFDTHYSDGSGNDPISNDHILFIGTYDACKDFIYDYFDRTGDESLQNNQ